MTTASDSEILTRVGPGTLLGNMMREYWIPAAASSELQAGGDPMRLMLLGEQLIAFRDHQRSRRHHGSPLSAPLRVAVLRTQRGGRAALRLSRLAVRRRRQLPGHAERTEASGFPQNASRPRATRDRAQRPDLDLHGQARDAAAAAELRAGAAARERIHQPVLRAARMQLAAGAGRRHRHLAFRLPARRRRDARRRRRDQPRPLRHREPRAGISRRRHRLGHDVRRATGPPMPARSTGASRTSCFRSGRCRPTASSAITSSHAPGCRWTTPTRCSCICPGRRTRRGCAR